MAGLTPNDTAKRNIAIKMPVTRMRHGNRSWNFQRTGHTHTLKTAASRLQRGDCTGRLGIGQRGVETRLDNEKMS